MTKPDDKDPNLDKVQEILADLTKPRIEKSPSGMPKGKPLEYFIKKDPSGKT